MGSVTKEHFVFQGRRIHQYSGNRSRNRHDRAHRQVHAAGGDHQGHANRQEHDGRTVPEDVDQAAVQVAFPVLDGEKTGDEDEIKKQDQQQSQDWEKEPALREIFPFEGFERIFHDSLPAMAWMMVFSSTSPENSATFSRSRNTTTRWLVRSTSSSSEEMNTHALPSSASESTSF